MALLRSRLRGLHHEQRGQIAFITLFGAVALVGLLGLVMTTGDQVAAKIRVQNAADAAALSGGSWIARGLNLTAAVNVLQSQLAGAAIALQALDDTLKISGPIVEGMNAAYDACTVFFPPCAILAGLTAFQMGMLQAVEPAVAETVRLLASCSQGMFWRVARALEVLNGAVNVSFYAIALAETFLVARADGADLAILLPGPLFYGRVAGAELLPTRKGEVSDLCDAMEHGSPTREQRGYTKLLDYPPGQGPFALAKCRLSWAAAFVTGFPPVSPVLLPFLANVRRDQLCGAATPEHPTTQVERPTRDLAECRRLGGKARWTVNEMETREPVSAPDGCAYFGSVRGSRPPPYDGIPNLKVFSQYNRVEERPCSQLPDGVRLDERTYCVKDLRHILTDESPVSYLHSLTIYTLDTATVPQTVEAPDPPAESERCQLPRPYLLHDDDDALKFLVVARRANRRIFFSERFLEDPPALYAYAQVEVYSGISADTWNQDWRVRLERAYLLEKPFETLGQGISGQLDRLPLPAELPSGALSGLMQGLLGDLSNQPSMGDPAAGGQDGDNAMRRLLNH